MDSHRSARGMHLVELLKPYGYEAMCNIDTFILLFCSVGLWLSSIPHIVHSLRMIQDSSTKELFFQQPSSVLNYEDDSYNALLSNQSTKAATLIFLYAKWDADSRQSRSVIEDVNQFSPMEVLALSCWKNPCSTEVEPKRYPELRVHIKDFGHLTYRGHYGSLHISNFVSHALRPLRFVSSEDELARLLLTHKFTIVSYFGVPSWRSAEQNGFYRAALLFSDPLASKKTLEVSGIDLTKNLIFVVATFRNEATQQKNQGGTQSSTVRKFPLTIYVQCENSKISVDSSIDYISARQLAARIVKNIEIGIATSKCPIHPVDITPTYAKRSTALHSVLSAGPVLLLTGPHLSLLTQADEHLYLLRSLQTAYTSCSNNTSTSPVRSNSGNDTGPQNIHRVGRDAHRLLHAMASEARQRLQRTASVCPQWLQEIGSQLRLSPVRMCGVPDSVTELSANASLTDREGRISLLRTMDRIQLLLRNTSTREVVTHQAHAFLWKLSADGPVPRTTVKHLDDAATVEHMQLTCCRWLHLRSLSGRQLSSENYLDAPGLLLHDAARNGGVSPPTLADRLGCENNRTLRFHTLDASIAPTLAWELAGYDERTRKNQIGAAIVDHQAEAVYRLEEPVTYESLGNFVAQYHNSTLNPWRRHPLLNTTSISRHPNLINIHTADHFKSLLDSRTQIHSAAKGYRNNPIVISSLVVLYYSRTCGLSTHGDSLMWHFESVARSLARDSAVTFAKVDVSTVELPWELRVERIPAIILFPAQRSSYSVVFPPTTSMDDISASLTRFIHDESTEQPVTEPTPDATNPYAFSFWAREVLLGALNSFKGRLTSPVIEKIYEHCDVHTIKAVRGLCRVSLRLAINNYRTRIVQAQTASISLSEVVQKRLNEVNEQLTSDVVKLYIPRTDSARLKCLLETHSSLWVKIRSYQSALYATQRFLTSGNST